MKTPVIIYEPDEQSRMLLTVSFKAWGFEAIHAPDERTALAAAKDDSFIVTDCDRAERTAQFLKRIAERSPRTRVIGYISPELTASIRSLSRLGLLSFFVKPLEVRELHYAFIKTIKTSLSVEPKEREGDFSVKEHRELVLPPDPLRIPLAVRQLTGLAERLPNPHLARFYLHGLIENAVIYGALELSRERIIAAYESNGLGALIERACDAATDRERTVRITYDVTPAALTYTIVDPGKGFHWRAAMKAVTEGDYTAAGRTISLAKLYFDEMRYNDAGNEVTAIKRTGARAR